MYQTGKIVGSLSGETRYTASNVQSTTDVFGKWCRVNQVLNVRETKKMILVMFIRDNPQLGFLHNY